MNHYQNQFVSQLSTVGIFGGGYLGGDKQMETNKNQFLSLGAAKTYKFVSK